MFLINTRNSNPSLHPDKTCHECYCVIFTVIKKKSSVITAIFENQTERLWCNWTFAKRSTWNMKIWLQEKKGRQKAQTKESFWCQRFFDWLTTAVQLQEANNKYLNSHDSLFICKICSKIIKRPIKSLECECKYCLNCLMATFRGKT